MRIVQQMRLLILRKDAKLLLMSWNFHIQMQRFRLVLKVIVTHWDASTGLITTVLKPAYTSIKTHMERQILGNEESLEEYVAQEVDSNTKIFCISYCYESEMTTIIISIFFARRYNSDGRENYN